MEVSCVEQGVRMIGAEVIVDIFKHYHLLKTQTYEQPQSTWRHRTATCWYPEYGNMIAAEPSDFVV